MNPAKVSTTSIALVGIEILDVREVLGNIDKPRISLENVMLEGQEASVIC
jgi:hypothetical protein